MQVTRESYITPGYDCRVECQHEVKGEHGQACPEWIYIVKDGDAALTLVVASGEYPDGARNAPDARDLTLHVGWRIDGEQVRTNSSGRECDYVDGGRCFTSMSSVLGARDFFVARGRTTFEQPEEFWVALEAWFEQLRATTPHADDVFKQCPTCRGAGIVEKGAGWPEAVERASDAALRLGLKTDSRCPEFYLGGWRRGVDYGSGGSHDFGVRYQVRTQYTNILHFKTNEQIARAFVRGYRDGRRTARRAKQIANAEAAW